MAGLVSDTDKIQTSLKDTYNGTSVRSRNLQNSYGPVRALVTKLGQ